MRISTALISLFLVATPLHANTITNCSGSWDGVGQTTCEILGVAGYTNESFDFTNFILLPQMFEITARNENNNLFLELNGSLTYTNEYNTYNSYIHLKQFAYWIEPTRVVVGIEDLDWLNGDYDYNDYVAPLVETTQFKTIPEPTSLTLLGITLLRLSRKIFKRV